MKFKKALVAVIAASTLVFGMTALSACANQSDEEQISEAVENSMRVYKDPVEETYAMLSTTMGTVEGNTIAELGINVDDYIKEILGGFDYSLSDITVDGKTATAQLTLTHKPLEAINAAISSATGSVIANGVTNSESSAEVNTQLGEAIMTAISGVEAVPCDPIEITLEKGDAWEISADSLSVINTHLVG